MAQVNDSTPHLGDQECDIIMFPEATITMQNKSN